MRPRLFILLALPLLAIVPALACDSGVRSVQTVQRVADDVATLAAPEGSSPGENPDAARPLSPDVAAVIATLNELPVAGRGSDVEYNRKDWRHWVDADQDCQDARAEVLIVESRSPVSFAPNDDGDECRVTAGEWLGPWSGEVFTDASDVDIDHHVPLGHAHASGGWRWNADRKREYANDLANPPSLQVTGASVNRSKGKKPPDAWRPEHRAGWCRYAADWIDVKSRWELTVTQAEIRALKDMLDTCGDRGSWGLSGPPIP